MTRWLLLVLIGLNAATCGQKGPLYREPPSEAFRNVLDGAVRGGIEPTRSGRPR